MTWLLYGATGYTGRLVAREAVARGERPVLAGRSAAALAPLAAELGLEHRVVGLGDATALREALADVDAVAHCAGPFSATALPMAEACLDTGTHYLDITGEIDVLEALHALDDRARAAGVVLLPGAGFDVVPTDCLAATVAAALPTATHLDIAFVVGGGPSPGTARSALEALDKGAGGRARIDGVIREVPLGYHRVTASFRTGERSVASIAWGDVSTAYHSTGVPNISTYTWLPGAPLLERVLGIGPVRRLARAGVDRFLKGPGERALARSRSQVWARARDAHGGEAQAALSTPNGYALTVDSVLRIVTRLPGLPHGTRTPSSALGADFVLELDGVRRNGPRLH
ncbi:saccharopine dehydrogenase NADP-binding domain-containing protein [Streptomyces sp. NPDC026673]|uniref:saccharopine dehydrogenase family protein n=1 Tax=Streptomyces sp. NPDC026673 TaxID=3155724 RepID=UPI0033E76AD1